MKTVVSFPSTAVFGQQAALAFHEAGQLSRFETTFVYNEDGLLARLIGGLPQKLRGRVEPQLRRRALQELPSGLVRMSSTLEIVRTLAQTLRMSPVLVDCIWDQMSHEFTRSVAGRLKTNEQAIYAYEYTALEAFQAARDRGIRTILDFPSLDSREFERQQDLEKEKFPELIDINEGYFKARFETRQARRDAERGLADLIITNSSVTRASHIAAGAPADRTIAVPYGAPPTIDAIVPRLQGRPLKLVWAGTFSIRKGAHYLVDALRRVGLGAGLEVSVYGSMAVPKRVWQPCPPNLKFYGSVPRSILFEAFDSADALIFPTLSDGFGMVITEAFARGLPVITTRRAGGSDLVRDGVNGIIVADGDADALAETIIWCMEHREALQSMQASALETARHWQWADYRRALRAAVNAEPFVTPSTSSTAL